MKEKICIRYPGLCEYQVSLEAMKQFTRQRDQNTPDGIWCLQHPPVYTLGMAGKEEHILNPGKIPVVKTDRGGQVTYHGPGQLVVYLLIDLARRNLTVKGFVSELEQAMIDMLAELNVTAERHSGAPGVYVENKKIAALGIRVKHGCSYHGLALNVDMDLSPFEDINPCGYPGLQVTQLSEHGYGLDTREVFSRLLPHLSSRLGYGNYDPVEDAGAMIITQKIQAA